MLNPLVVNLAGSSLLCIGGIVGFLKSGSITSAAAGILFAAVITLLTLYYSSNGPTSNKGLRYIMGKLNNELITINSKLINFFILKSKLYG